MRKQVEKVNPNNPVEIPMRKTGIIIMEEIEELEEWLENHQGACISNPGEAQDKFNRWKELKKDLT